MGGGGHDDGGVGDDTGGDGYGAGGDPSYLIFLQSLLGRGLTRDGARFGWERQERQAKRLSDFYSRHSLLHLLLGGLVKANISL